MRRSRSRATFEAVRFHDPEHVFVVDDGDGRDDCRARRRRRPDAASPSNPRASSPSREAGGEGMGQLATPIARRVDLRACTPSPFSFRATQDRPRSRRGSPGLSIEHSARSSDAARARGRGEATLRAHRRLAPHAHHLGAQAAAALEARLGVPVRLRGASLAPLSKRSSSQRSSRKARARSFSSRSRLNRSRSTTRPCADAAAAHADLGLRCVASLGPRAGARPGRVRRSGERGCGARARGGADERPRRAHCTQFASACDRQRRSLRAGVPLSRVSRRRAHRVARKSGVDRIPEPRHDRGRVARAGSPDHVRATRRRGRAQRGRRADRLRRRPRRDPVRSLDVEAPHPRRTSREFHGSIARQRSTHVRVSSTPLEAIAKREARDEAESLI